MKIRMFQELTKFLWLTSALFIAIPTFPTFAAECDWNTAEELNTSVRANFALLETEGLQDRSERDKIEMLEQNFSDVTRLHDYALKSDDQPSLKLICQMYEAILDQQAVMRQ